jgi:hypothetical protein
MTKIKGVKLVQIQEFYVSLGSFHNIDIENELAFFILNCKLQIMAKKKKLEIKLAI